MSSKFRCSEAALGQPMAGSAAVDAGFLLIEHPGPWGSKALAESRLVPEPVKEWLAAEAAARGVRIQLIRRPVTRRATSGHRVFLAHPASGRLDVADLDDLAQLADLDLGLSTRAGPWQPYDGYLLLVCTNGRRDVCCAEFGRPVALAAAAADPVAVWETTHLGGHRFAVAALTLPDGMSYGRLDAETVLAVLGAAAQGEVAVPHLRGRTAYVPVVQAAEAALLEHLGEVRGDALRLVGADGMTVSFASERAVHDVEMVAVEHAPARQSCADLVEKPSTTYAVRALTVRGGSASGSP